MSSTYDDSNRQTMPRCLDYHTACSVNLLRRIRIKERDSERRTISSSIKQEWRENPSIDSAVDVVGEAMIIQDYQLEEAKKAANYILDKATNHFSLIRGMAKHFLEKPLPVKFELNPEDPVELRRKRIARLKKSVRSYPINPIAWTDLALYYATLGQEEKAKSAMNIALNLGGSNRFILRSASRCYTHMNEPDRAVSILRKSGLCTIDPWILSAEIAISEGFGFKSKNVSKAKYIVDDNNMTEFSRSELTASLATIEMKSGSTRKSKRYIRQAIQDPTENALAQVEWLSNRIKTDIPDISSISRNVPASFEAVAKHLYYEKKYKKSVEVAELWADYQPLSSRPILHSSHVAAMYMDDDNEAIRILDKAMPAQRDDPLILNNYAFSYARSGKLEQAIEYIKKVDLNRLGSRERYIINATRGLIAFRGGDPIKGRLLYTIAIKGFEEYGDNVSADVAMYFLANEEKRIKSEYARSTIGSVKNRVEKHCVSELEELVKRL